MSLISIIIPTYNRAQLIKETLESIINQTYTNWECIVVDDGSTDDTIENLLEYRKKDARFQYFKRPKNNPKGPSSCRNYGLKKSKGKYINWFDSDDIMFPNKLEVDLKNITSGNYDFTISQSQFFENKTNKLVGCWNENLYSENPINDFILLKIGWGINSPLWKKESLLNNNLLFEERILTAEDYFYHIQAIEFNLKPIIINQVLVKQRVHSNRLENYKIKSHFKLLVLLYLIKNKKHLTLNLNTISVLINQSHNQISNLYKNKKWLKAINHSFKLFNYLDKNKIINLFLIGTFYKVTSKGYKYIH